MLSWGYRKDLPWPMLQLWSPSFPWPCISGISRDWAWDLHLPSGFLQKELVAQVKGWSELLSNKPLANPGVEERATWTMGHARESPCKLSFKNDPSSITKVSFQMNKCLEGPLTFFPPVWLIVLIISIFLSLTNWRIFQAWSNIFLRRIYPTESNPWPHDWDTNLEYRSLLFSRTKLRSDHIFPTGISTWIFVLHLHKVNASCCSICYLKLSKAGGEAFRNL